MHRIQPFEANIFRIFRGSMPPHPPSMQILWPLLPITIASLPTTKRGTLGGTQYRNTARKIDKSRNTVSKIDEIPIPHLDPFNCGHAYFKLHPRGVFNSRKHVYICPCILIILVVGQ